MSRKRLSVNDPIFCTNKAILRPKNADFGCIIEEILNSLDGLIEAYSNAQSTHRENESRHFAVEIDGIYSFLLPSNIK
jgi:hypothetical protein